MATLLPDRERILLGPGPSRASPRVMRAMCAPTVGHLDPIMLKIWRVGLMGASSAMEPIALFLGALDQTLAAQTRALV